MSTPDDLHLRPEGRPGRAADRVAPPADEAVLKACSRDEVLRGRFRLWQPRQGYRFSMDAVLVAHFAWQSLVASSRRGVSRAADLGAGSGVVGLALAERCADLNVDLVEIQERLASLAATNAAQSGLAERITVHRADLRSLAGLLPGDAYALVVSNPPFWPAAAGRQSPDAERATAMAEHQMTLEELVASGARLLRPRGALCVIYPAERLGDLLAACQSSGLQPTRLRSVHSAVQSAADRLLLEARKASRSPLRWLAPLVIHASSIRYTDEAADILDGEWEDPEGEDYYSGDVGSPP